MSLPLPYGLSLIPLPVAVPPDRREYVDGNNQIQNARYINPLTMDFEISANGHFVGENLVDQQVYLALITDFGTACQADLGNKIKTVKMITPGIITTVSTIINSCLSNLVQAGSITINNLQVALTQQPGQISIQLTFTNNETATQNVINLPVSAGI